MRFLKICYSFLRRKCYDKKNFSFLATTNNFRSKSVLSEQFLGTNKLNIQLVHTENYDNEEVLEDFPFLETEQFERHEIARNSLFKGSTDKIINELTSCISVEEVLNLVKKYINIYKDKHITQTIFMLRDMQNVFYQYKGLSEANCNDFIENLHKHEEFGQLLSFFDNKLNNFDPEYLSYSLLYLKKLGISVEDPRMQVISLKVRDQLLNNFSLGRCSRFLKVIFTENSVRPYYMSLNIIPKVTNQIEICESVEELGNLTNCLRKLHNIVTNNLLAKYKEKIADFLKNNRLKATDYPTLLNIIMFLNYPRWRNENVSLTSDCIMLMKPEINSFTVNQLLLLHEVFFKNQEPGDVLNSIQRCSAKFLKQLQEIPTSQINVKLKLFSSLIYFSSRNHRIHFRKDIEKYLKDCDNYISLVLLRRIFSYIKISDPKLCMKYWNLSLKMLDKDKSTPSILNLCENYMNFNIDIENFRHYRFERRIMELIDQRVKEETVLFPSVVSGFLSFAMVYGNNGTVLKFLMEKFEKSLSQFNTSDCLKLSHSFLLLADIKDPCILPAQIKTMENLLNKRTEELLNLEEDNFFHRGMLLKGAIIRNDFKNVMDKDWLVKFKEMEYMSSKMLENICYLFLATDALIPEVINKCTEYVIKNHINVLAFNAEKLLYLCYHFAYYPINAEKFFQVVIDIIIRDQERLSGLALVQSALSLCFFSKLPSFFIKQIFNVEFLEKLDLELANCYSKDKYPHRVRTRLMQLNRAVCLEYPEFDVPWFHKKFIEEFQKKFKDVDNNLPQRVKEYLIEVLGKPEYVLQNFLTPYGYHIDFVVNLNKKEEVVAPNSTEISRRVALLLIQQYAFTQFYTHLKGKYQLKIRHLEMFGYDVAIIHCNEWVNLLYGEERLEYLSKLIWPGYLKGSVTVCKR